MYKGWFTSVVIPAKDEAAFINDVIVNIPEWVDLVLVMNDGSIDDTNYVAKKALDKIGRNDYENDEKGPWGKIIKLEGFGVGNAIMEGCKYIITSENSTHQKSYDERKSACIVMAGDGQMKHSDLSQLLEPIIMRKCRYSKGNRFSDQGIKNMPLIRRIGSNFLSILTTLASGIYVRDPQCGYTVTELSVLQDINLEKIWRGYGYPNWLLLKFGKEGVKVKESPITCIYREENSGIRLWKFLPVVSVMLFLGLWDRGWNWYVKGEGVPRKLWVMRLVMILAWFGTWFSIMIFLNPLIHTSEIISNKVILVQVAVNISICYIIDKMEIKRRMSYSTQ